MPITLWRCIRVISPDVFAVVRLQPEEMSEPLKRQWQALPEELNPLFIYADREGIEC